VIGNFAYALRGNVGAGDMCALGGEHFGGGATHAAGGAGDEDD